MTIQYILDTDTATYHQLGRETIVRHLHQVPSDEIATTVITMYEQMRGRLAAINRKQPLEQLKLAFQKLQLTQIYYCRVPVLPFDDKAAAWFQRLESQKLQIGIQDLRIAAIVLAHDAVLITSNLRHFELVPNLKVDNWNR